MMAAGKHLGAGPGRELEDLARRVAFSNRLTPLGGALTVVGAIREGQRDRQLLVDFVQFDDRQRHRNARLGQRRRALVERHVAAQLGQHLAAKLRNVAGADLHRPVAQQVQHHGHRTVRPHHALLAAQVQPWHRPRQQHVLVTSPPGHVALHLRTKLDAAARRVLNHHRDGTLGAIDGRILAIDP